MDSNHVAANVNANAALQEVNSLSLTEEKKTRRCLRCKQERPIEQFASTPSRFFPGHRSMICTPCLEATTLQDNLGEVDRVLRWLDLPFDLNRWTQLYE